jgi:hypothetical protein
MINKLLRLPSTTSIASLSSRGSTASTTRNEYSDANLAPVGRIRLVYDNNQLSCNGSLGPVPDRDST